MIRRSVLSFTVAAAALANSAAFSEPARIIILRHGEKQNGYQLCEVGTQRAQALASRYLGKGAEASLFAEGGAPDAFFAITPHTLELVSPAGGSRRDGQLVRQDRRDDLGARPYRRREA